MTPELRTKAEVMTMVTMNISLPEILKTFIDARMAEADYHTASEYVGELVRLDQARVVQQRLESVLLAQVEGDDWEAMSPADKPTAIPRYV